MKPKGNGDPRIPKNDNPEDKSQKGGFRDYQPGDDDFDEDFKEAGESAEDKDFDEFGEEDDDYDDEFIDNDEDVLPAETASTFPGRKRRAYHLVAAALKAANEIPKSRSYFWQRLQNSKRLRQFTMGPLGLSVLMRHLRLSQNINSAPPCFLPPGQAPLNINPDGA